MRRFLAGCGQASHAPVKVEDLTYPPAASILRRSIGRSAIAASTGRKGKIRSHFNLLSASGGDCLDEFRPSFPKIASEVGRHVLELGPHGDMKP